MYHLHANDIARYTGAKLSGHPADGSIVHLLIDSRKLLFPDTSLFFAIRTESGDGHRYIDDLYQQGVRHFVVDHFPDAADKPEATFYVVDDVVKALQDLVAAHRSKYHIPVIGITGSNGKTIVKEWLYHLLQPFFNIVRSPRSFNSQLGVPLSVWPMEAEHQLGIFEAGISRKDEMQYLQQVIRPTMGIMTNLGDAHNEGFFSKDEKLKEKCHLFEGCETVVYCRDHAMIDQHMKQLEDAGRIGKLYTWGRDPRSHIRLLDVSRFGEHSRLTLSAAGRNIEVVIPYQDLAAIENAMHCFTAAHALGAGDAIIPLMEDLPPLQMRLEVKEGHQGCTLINDSYNADLNGLVTALDFMALQPVTMPRTAVLSDLTGIVGSGDEQYRQVAQWLALKGVKKLFAVGPVFGLHLQLFQQVGIEVRHYHETSSLLKDPSFLSVRNELVLIKGARKFGFEQVSRIMESKGHQTRLEVDLSAIAHNLKQYKDRQEQGTRIMAMVKAFSYGAGSFEVANLLQYYHIDQIAVAYVDEGVELRKAGIHSPIMVMNTEVRGFQSLVDHHLEPVVYSLEIIDSLHAYLMREGISFFPVHLKLDTGMHRLGLNHADINRFLERYATSRAFKIRSVFTHLVAAEDPDSDDFTRQQLDDFEQCCGRIQEELGYHFIRHAANTAAIARHPRAAYEMVRLGIGLYGIDTGRSGLPLQEAVSLKTTIAQIRRVSSGDTVGYGRKAVLQRDSVIATIRIGYADGFPRSLGQGRGRVWIAGDSYPVVGNVCMDMTMIDITDGEGITTGDEVLIFGPDYSIVEVAKAAGTIPYEIMTGISQRVPRVYLSA